MVQVWRGDKLKPATIQTYLSFLRGLALWTGKPGFDAGAMDRMLAEIMGKSTGVCGGIAEYLGWNPVLVRGIKDALRHGRAHSKVAVILGCRQNLPPELVRSVSIAPDHMQRVRAAMVDVTRPGGTAAQAGAGYPAPGGTGTADDNDAAQARRYDTWSGVRIAPEDADFAQDAGRDRVVGTAGPGGSVQLAVRRVPGTRVLARR